MFPFLFMLTISLEGPQSEPHIFLFLFPLTGAVVQWHLLIPRWSQDGLFTSGAVGLEFPCDILGGSHGRLHCSCTLPPTTSASRSVSPWEETPLSTVVFDTNVLPLVRDKKTLENPLHFLPRNPFQVSLYFPQVHLNAPSLSCVSGVQR